MVAESTQKMQSESFSGPLAWVSETMLPSDGRVRLDAVCVDELRDTAQALRDNPLPVTALRPVDFDLPACAALMARIKHTLDHGVGFTIIDGVPLDDLDVETVRKIYWLLLALVGRPVAQKWNGEMIYDVVDTGRKPAAGNGVRSSKSNAGQIYHTDNSFNLPPEYVALLCLHPAMAGGESGLISFDSVYNGLLDACPDVLPRLYQPFLFDRQREHAPDDRPFSSAPVFEFDGSCLSTRLATSLIRQGYALAAVDVDDETAAALTALDEMTESDGLGKTFRFERGQIQIVNNRRIGHRRTAFVDWPEPERRRHLIRIWLRDHGRAFYLG